MKKVLLFLILALLMVSCADSVSYQVLTENPHIYGFWGGLWHGLIIPYSFIGSLFSDEISIYAISNNGAFYNLGFALGSIITFRTTHNYYTKNK